MIIPWPCVVALRLEPVGPIKADCFGLRAVDAEYVEWWSGENSGTYYTAARYHVAEPRRLAQLRDALGQFVHDPRLNQVPFHPERHPFYTLLCSVHVALTVEVGNG